MASSMARKCGCGCLPATTTLTYWRRRRQWSVGGKQRVGVRRQVDADDVAPFVDNVIDETGILVAKSVVVLSPDMRRQQIIQATRSGAPRNLGGTFSHFAC